MLIILLIYGLLFADSRYLYYTSYSFIKVELETFDNPIPYYPLPLDKGKGKCIKKRGFAPLGLSFSIPLQRRG
jgi:hypothetical protein